MRGSNPWFTVGAVAVLPWKKKKKKLITLMSDIKFCVTTSTTSREGGFFIFYFLTALYHESANIFRPVDYVGVMTQCILRNTRVFLSILMRHDKTHLTWWLTGSQPLIAWLFFLWKFIVDLKWILVGFQYTRHVWSYLIFLRWPDGTWHCCRVVYFTVGR